MAAAVDYDVMGKRIVDASEKLNYPGTDKLSAHMTANSHHVQYDILNA